MDKPIELSLEQQFAIRSFEAQVQKMSHDQAQDFLVQLFSFFQKKELVYQSLLGFKLPEVPDMLSLEDCDSKVLVDFEDTLWLTQWKWYSSVKGYPRRNVCGTADTASTLMHRVILEFHGVPLGGKDVDHINGNPLDCRKANLRVCEHRDNCASRKLSRNNTSGYKGVSSCKEKWKAYIKVDYRQICLGTFTSKEEAALAYNKAAIEHFGEYARLNILPSSIDGDPLEGGGVHDLDLDSQS